MIRSTLIYGVAGILPTLLGFVLLPIYSRQLSTSEYGIIASMGVLSGVLAVFSNLALDRAAFRFYFDSDNAALRRKLLGTFFIGSIGISVLFFALMLLCKPLLTQAYPEVPFYPYYFFTLITISLSVCEIYIMGYFRIAEKPRAYLFMIFAQLCLQGGLITYFVLLKEQGAFGQSRALLTAALCLLPVYMVVAYKNFSFSFNWNIFKEGVNFSWPFIPTLLIAWILNWSDSVFIAHFCTMNEVGLYSMAYKISMVFFMITGAFSVAYNPVFFKNANQVDFAEGKRNIYTIIQIASQVFILIAFLLALFSREIVTLLLDAKYHTIHIYIRIIILSHIFSAIMGISSNLYYLQSKKSKLQLAVVSASALLNIVMNYLLVPRFGIYGAAWATVFSVMVLTIMHYQFSRSCFFVEIVWSKITMLIFICSGVIIGFQYFLEDSWAGLPAKIILIIILISLAWNNQGLRQSIKELKAQ